MAVGRRSWLSTVVVRRCVRPRCVVCGCSYDYKFRECPCSGLYCFVDVGRCCPLCHLDDTPTGHLDNGYHDDDDDDKRSVEGGLRLRQKVEYKFGLYMLARTDIFGDI